MSASDAVASSLGRRFRCQYCPAAYTSKVNLRAHTAVRHNTQEPEVSLAQAIGETLGAASMCWVGGTGDLVFDSERASALVDELGRKVEARLEAAWRRGYDARREEVRSQTLGEVPTRDVLGELQLRGDLAMTAMPTTDRGADGAALSALAGALIKASCAETLEAVRGE